MDTGFSFSDFGTFRPGRTGLTATGSTQADAAPLHAAVNLFTVVPAGSGCQLPSVQASNTLEITVLNRGTSALNVYPPQGGQIEALGVNAPFQIQSGYSALFSCFDPPLAPGRHWSAVLEQGSAMPGQPTVIISATPPTGVSPGWMWWNTNDGNTYVWYDDGNSQQWVPAVATAGAQGGPFLPTAGGTMAGPLNVTATGANTSRSVQDHFGEVINVKDYGAKGDGTTDDTAALNAAAAAIPATGGTLYLPKGTYSVSGTLLVKSLTRVVGDGWGSVIRAAAGWPNSTTYELLMNAGYAASSITDHDIIVADLQLDYGSRPGSPPAAPMYSGLHAIHFRMARNVQVGNCLIQCRSVGNDAVAMVACDTTLIDGCVAYDMINASYDHWWNAANAKVVNCYARGTAPCVLFNPEPDSGAGTGNADNFLLSGTTLINTSATRSVCQFEPLGTGTTVSNVTAVNNHFVNVGITARGAVTGTTIIGNTFSGMTDCPAIGTWTANGGTPDGFVIASNVIENPTTSGSAPIQAQLNGATITGNRVTGTAYGSTPGIDTSSFAPTVVGNSVSNGITNALSSISSTGNVATANGQGYVWADNGGNKITFTLGTDNHMIWYGTGSTGSQRLMMDMYQRSDTSAMAWSVPMTFAGSLSGAGITNLFAAPPATGGTTPAAGTFTTLTANNWLLPAYNANGAFPPSGNEGAIGFNQTAGSAEIAYFNCYTNPAVSHIFFQRTGASSATRLMDITPTGNVVAYGGVTLINGAGPTIRAGTGAATGTQPKGSLWLRTDGAAGSTLYVTQGGGTWAAVAGV